MGSQKSKRLREIAKLFEPEKLYTVEEAVEILKKCPEVKFDQSVEFALVTGVDPRKADQNVRGTVSLPHGTGKTLTIVAVTSDDKVEAAKAAGADYAGNTELIKKIAGGWTDFDALVTSPDMMREVGKLGKVLGPRGLMPTPKAGTVSADIGKAVQELKGGKIEFKVDKHAVIHAAVGKISFSAEKLGENIKVFFQAVMRLKPSSAKGQYVTSIAASSTMGPGIKIAVSELETA